MVRKLASGEYRLYSRKVDPRTKKRRNLGTFKTRAAAEQSRARRAVLQASRLIRFQRVESLCRRCSSSAPARPGWSSRSGCARSACAVRIIDKTAEPGTTSRALAVHARTLELYRQLGLADAVVARGLKFAAANLWVPRHEVARVSFGDIGRGLSPYPVRADLPAGRARAAA